MPLCPDRRASVAGRLIDVWPAIEGRFRIGRVERRLRGETVETAAAQMGKLIDQHVTHGAQFARKTGLAQNACR